MSVIKFSLIFFLFSVLAACGLFKDADPKADNHDMTVKIECIQNHMPISSQSSYVILQFFPADTVFTENFKVIGVTATGLNGTWKGVKLDIPGFSGKDAKMLQNNVRDFDPSIGQPYSFIVNVQFESGETKQFEVQNVPLMHVS